MSDPEHLPKSASPALILRSSRDPESIADMGFVMLAILFAALLYGAARVRRSKRKNQASSLNSVAVKKDP
jgi:hypothetical protein